MYLGILKPDSDNCNDDSTLGLPGFRVCLVAIPEKQTLAGTSTWRPKSISQESLKVFGGASLCNPLAPPASESMSSQQVLTKSLSLESACTAHPVCRGETAASWHSEIIIQIRT